MLQPTLLIADDERHVTYALSHKLEKSGFTVIVARNGEEGMRLARERHPDLVVTDFQMPMVSGLEMAMILRATPSTADIPVIMITARGYRISDEELAETNIKHIFAKPFSPSELVREDRGPLARKQRRRVPDRCRLNHDPASIDVGPSSCCVGAPPTW